MQEVGNCTVETGRRLLEANNKVAGVAVQRPKVKEAGGKEGRDVGDVLYEIGGVGRGQIRKKKREKMWYIN